jgi:hypothetical protein
LLERFPNGIEFVGPDDGENGFQNTGLHENAMKALPTSRSRFLEMCCQENDGGGESGKSKVARLQYSNLGEGRKGKPSPEEEDAEVVFTK